MDWRKHYDTDFVQGHVERALEHLRAFADGYLESRLKHMGLESPLEMAFVAWWEVVNIERGAFGGDAGILVPQHSVDGGRYRLDFALMRGGMTADDENQLKIAIELDGHEFHERTKEQVACRNARDRYLADAGWVVFHFSGSEFHRNPMACIDEVWSAGQRRL